MLAARYALLGALLGSVDAAANVSSVTVFTKGEKCAPHPTPITGHSAACALRRGYVGMRIPAIIMIPEGPNKGHLLAFCECGQPHAMESPAGTVDTGCDICSKSSTTNGKTWGPLQVVVKNSSQPSPVYNSVAKTIVMNFNGAPLPPHPTPH